jgi:hypothetical protein
VGSTGSGGDVEDPGAQLGVDRAEELPASSDEDATSPMSGTLSEDDPPMSVAATGCMEPPTASMPCNVTGRSGDATRPPTASAIGWRKTPGGTHQGLICTGAGVETGVDTGCICGECDTGACNALEKSCCCCTEKSKTGNTDMVGSLVRLVTTLFPGSVDGGNKTSE